MKTAPASRSAGTTDRPCAHFVKFTEEQNVRLHEAVRRDAKASIQAFIHEAAMVALIASEKAYREDEEYRERRKLEKKAQKVKIDPSIGLNIRDRLSQPIETPRAAEPPPPPQPQIVIEAKQVTQDNDADVDLLAIFVVSGGAKW